MEDTKRELDGYLFYSKEDCSLALLEKKKIEYIEKHMDYSTPENVLLVYQKAIKERIFKTPIGLSYLKRLQGILQNSSQIAPEDIFPIQIYQSFETRMRSEYIPVKERIKPDNQKKKRDKLFLSIILNILLIIALIAMFQITMTADSPNILNYMTNITNKYAAWDQELTQREQVVREKEKELNIKWE